MDVAPDRHWSPRPLPPPTKPAPTVVVSTPEGQVLVPPREDEAPDPVLLPLTGAFLLFVAWLLTRRGRPILGAQLPLRR